jgi:hypothetical protein
MSKTIYLFIALAMSACAKSVPAVEAVDTGSYLRQQGWKPYEGKPAAKSPVPDVAPLMYYDKGNSVPSCGIITGSTDGKRPGFIELVGSDQGVNYPQCLDIASITPFRMQNKDYIAVEYLSRETREETDRGYHYLVRDSSRGIVTDEALTEAVPSTPAEGARRDPAAAGQGVRLARVAHVTKAYPGWSVLDRDFISDPASSFAILENKKTQQCQFVAESGTTSATTAHTVFAPAAKCAEVLASSRYEKNGKVFYLAMFRDQARKQLVGLVSVASDGSVSAEKALAESINRAGATKDLKSAKTALAKELQ